MKTTFLPLIPGLILALTATGLSAQGSATHGAVSADEPIVVRGQRLSDLRAELEAARVHVFDVFNEFSSSWR
jgi:hypothetical protein